MIPKDIESIAVTPLGYPKRLVTPGETYESVTQTIGSIVQAFGRTEASAADAGAIAGGASEVGRMPYGSLGFDGSGRFAARELGVASTAQPTAAHASTVATRRGPLFARGTTLRKQRRRKRCAAGIER